MTAAKCGRVAHHWACFRDVSYEVIDKIIELGGKDLVMAQTTEKRFTFDYTKSIDCNNPSFD